MELLGVDLPYVGEFVEIVAFDILMNLKGNLVVMIATKTYWCVTFAHADAYTQTTDPARDISMHTIS